MWFGSNEDLHLCFFFNHKPIDARFGDFSILNKFIVSWDSIGVSLYEIMYSFTFFIVFVSSLWFTELLAKNLFASFCLVLRYFMSLFSTMALFDSFPTFLSEETTTAFPSQNQPICRPSSGHGHWIWLGQSVLEGVGLGITGLVWPLTTPPAGL